jgi:hypothetical protein
MLHVSFAMTSEAFANCSKTETRRFWKPAHAEKFKPGRLFMGLTKDFRAGGQRIHIARVVFCRKERLGDMSQESFVREGGSFYWCDRDTYIEAMGGREKVPWVLRFEHERCVHCGVEAAEIAYGDCWCDGCFMELKQGAFDGLTEEEVRDTAR